MTSASSTSKLAAEEEAIGILVTSLSGSIAERNARLAEEGVFAHYADIIARYLSLAEDAHGDLEALKRALFLTWYELVEPPCFTGVGDLPQSLRERAFAASERHFQSVDDEFRWMVAYYYDLAEYAFPSVATHPRLGTLVQVEDPEGWRAHHLSRAAMSGRGLMGRYWTSLID